MIRLGDIGSSELGSMIAKIRGKGNPGQNAAGQKVRYGISPNLKLKLIEKRVHNKIMELKTLFILTLWYDSHMHLSVK